MSFAHGVKLYTGIGAEAQDTAAAALAFRAAAELGYAPAQYAYGVCCRDGMGVEKNATEAVRWFRASAEQGYAPAQTTMGVCASSGEGMPRDAVEAVRWYRLAAEQNFPRALSNLAYCYSAGKGVEMNQSEALALYQKAADAGNAVAQNGMGWSYMKGLGVQRNYRLAIRWLKLAAAQGQKNALTNLGVCYSHAMDDASGEDIYRAYRAAADQGFSSAQELVGECYEDGVGVRKNMTLAAMWYRAAAEQGNRFAQYRLGSCYEYAKGVRYNAEEAVHQYRMAAVQKNPNAMVAYARCCMEEFGGAREDGESIFHLISEGLKLGGVFPYAETLLGECYERGIGVTPDPEKARSLYRSAMEQMGASPRVIKNYSRSLYLGIGGEKELNTLIDMWRTGGCDKDTAAAFFNELGVCYELGEGVEKDPEEAAEYYRRGAEAGDAVARFNLARCYDLGIGVPRRRARAAEWYFKSANKAFKPAIQAYEHMGLKLGPLYKNGRYHSMYVEGSQVPSPDAPAPKITEPIRGFLCGRECFAWEELPYKPSMELKMPDRDKDPTPAAEVPPAKTTAQLNEELVCAGDEHWAAGRREEAIQLYKKAAETWSNAARIRLALCALYGLGMPQDKAEAQRYATAAVNAGGGMSEVVDTLLKSAAE